MRNFMRGFWTSLLCVSLISPSGKNWLLAQVNPLSACFEEEAIVPPLISPLHEFTGRSIWLLKQKLGYGDDSTPVERIPGFRLSYPERDFYIVEPNNFRLIGEYNKWMNMKKQPDPV